MRFYAEESFLQLITFRRLVCAFSLIEQLLIREIFQWVQGVEVCLFSQWGQFLIIFYSSSVIDTGGMGCIHQLLLQRSLVSFDGRFILSGGIGNIKRVLCVSGRKETVVDGVQW